jgi:hypothetical protein
MNAEAVLDDGVHDDTGFHCHSINPSAAIRQSNSSPAASCQDRHKLQDNQITIKPLTHELHSPQANTTRTSNKQNNQNNAKTLTVDTLLRAVSR